MFKKYNMNVSGKTDLVDNFMKKAKGRYSDYYGPLNEESNLKEIFNWGDFNEIIFNVLTREAEEKRTVSSEVCLCMESIIPIPREVLLSPYGDEKFEDCKKIVPFWYAKHENLICGKEWEKKNWGSQYGIVAPNIISYFTCGENTNVLYEIHLYREGIYELMYIFRTLFPELTFEYKKL